MKKWCLFLSLYFCICLLAACAGGRLRRCGGRFRRHTRGGDPDRRRDDGARPGDGDLPAGDCGGRR